MRGLLSRNELDSLVSADDALGWLRPGAPKTRRSSFSLVLEPKDTPLGSVEHELKAEGVDLQDPSMAQDPNMAQKELEEEPQDPNRHEFVVPKMPKQRIKEAAPEEPRGPPAPPEGPPPSYPDEGYPEEDYGPDFEEPEVPLLDEDLERADIRYDSKVDPQLNRIADQVNAKIDMVEERLLGDRLQNLVVPFPATDASHDASTVHVFLGNPSSTTPDAGTPLDEVNQLLSKADSIEKELSATPQTQSVPAALTICACLLASRAGRSTARFTAFL
mmetsp:Transcript_60207/g.140723  ORF Transcript_60207/g.140723 Transcript_60207/m.140723 type:complete len:274 (-) Transcript_60207:106-927(-)